MANLCFRFLDSLPARRPGAQETKAYLPWHGRANCHDMPLHLQKRLLSSPGTNSKRRLGNTDNYSPSRSAFSTPQWRIRSRRSRVKHQKKEMGSRRREQRGQAKGRNRNSSRLTRRPRRKRRKQSIQHAGCGHWLGGVP